MGDRITYVGLDVHKADIVVAVAEGGQRGEVQEYGRIANTPAAVARLARQLSRDGVRLRFCYEAGPCGYGIQRQLSDWGTSAWSWLPADPQAGRRSHQDGSTGRRQSGAVGSGR